MNTEREEQQQRSSFEIQLVLNDRCYKGHFKSIENMKRILTETQKLILQAFSAVRSILLKWA